MANSAGVTSASPDDRTRALAGCLLGCAAGDSVALPYEGLSPRRIAKLARFPLEHRLLFGRGLVSDDTDHTIFVAQSLSVSGGDPEQFRAALAWRLRGWLLTLPAGIGFATLRGILKLWLGLRRSGVRSAGNGPAMRSAIIGAAYPQDAARRRALVGISTAMTHRDPRAEAAALAVAEVAAAVARGEWRERPAPAELTRRLREISADADWLRAVDGVEAACAAPDPEAESRARFGTRAGITGFCLHSVPHALVLWHRHFGDFRATIEGAVRAGGDTDTVAAIAGALAGAVVGPGGIPPTWLERLVDHPHGVARMRALAARLADPAARGSASFSPGLFIRSPIFMLIVLAHGFRRLLPPY